MATIDVEELRALVTQRVAAMTVPNPELTGEPLVSALPVPDIRVVALEESPPDWHVTTNFSAADICHMALVLEIEGQRYWASLFGSEPTLLDAAGQQVQELPFTSEVNEWLRGFAWDLWQSAFSALVQVAVSALGADFVSVADRACAEAVHAARHPDEVSHST